ncbi:GIY-YIG nuclease family protein [Candidatus Daviesbacteria bacterium]|nr:GIY-YIG nuclease family protein [Candidatus Daviesbacteria bacterium]
MAHFVYIVECNGGSYYTGITWNLKKRIGEHNSSGVKTPIQKSRLPVKLVYWESFETKIEAAKKEKEIKGWRRSKKELLISSLH